MPKPCTASHLQPEQRDAEEPPVVNKRQLYDQARIGRKLGAHSTGYRAVAELPLIIVTLDPEVNEFCVA
jgi:hypothetical protein